MILHFSHIGLTDGRTFTLASLSSWEPKLRGTFGAALATGAVAATEAGVAHSAPYALQAQKRIVATTWSYTGRSKVEMLPDRQ